MKRRLIDLRSQTPLLDIASYGRSAPGSFTSAQLDLIARTARRTPEVMVKVSGGAHSLRGVGSHIGYISREGSLDVETDMGVSIHGRGLQKAVIENWDLDLDAHFPMARAVREPRKPPKLVHNLIFSMPSGTPPTKVLQAVRKLAQEEWALKHRYIMVLHTDAPHPHVHVVLKARSEQGPRLNIRKATLRDWRQQFATNLRELGVAANATERAVRGQSKSNVPDGIYRADRRGESTYVQQRVREIEVELRAPGELTTDKGRETLRATRRAVDQGWRNVSFALANSGRHELALRVQRFVDGMRPPRTERELIAPQVPRPIRSERDRIDLFTR
jgi:hypothetical protein